MKVVCINNKLPGDGPSTYVLTVGREYLVIGFVVHSGEVQFEIPINPGTVVSIPIEFFEIVDSRASRFWHVRASPSGEVSLRPAEFDTLFFLDDASNAFEPAASALEALIERMQAE